MEKKTTRKKVSRCTDPLGLQFEGYPPANYTDIHAYHTAPASFTRSVELGGCVGVEIEMSFDKIEHGRDIFVDSLNSNVLWASTDASISGLAPLEVATVPLFEQDAVSPLFWAPICSRLVELGARSHKNHTTGLHVHVDRRKFYKKAANPDDDSYEIMCARTLYGMYVQDAEWKKRMFQRTGNREYAKNNVAGELIKMVQRIVPEAIHSKPVVERLIKEVRENSYDRYSEFNTSKPPTVEFRCGKGTLNPERIAATAEFALLFAKYCRCYGKKIPLTNQKHFDDFIYRHSRNKSLIKKIFKTSEEE